MMKRRYLCWSAIVAAACALCLVTPARAAGPDATLYVDTDNVLARNPMGFGFQWDPNDIWDYSEARWQRTFRRVDYMRPQFVRCCLSAEAYCHGFDASGKPAYDWNTPLVKRLERILGYCQSHHVDVMLGEWGPPFGLKWDDPRWSEIIGGCLDHLIRQGGYSCIRYYNKINEPHGDWQTYLTWRASQQSLHDELAKRKLLGRVILVGPDHSEGASALGWVDYMLKDGASLFGAYETHWYAGSASEIPNGDLEKTLREARQMVNARDPEGRHKRFFIGEAGTAEWLNGRDSNRYIRDFAYGVFMSDYAAQTMRAGLDGVSAWMLDDPMHQQPGSYPRGGVPSGDPKVDFDFKVWGFWNSLGAAMGKPEDENLRPWFYSWSLLMRLFPRGAQTVACSDPYLRGVRLAAAVLPNGRKRGLSLLLVNDATIPRRFRVVVPSAQGSVTLTEYRYFERERPVDSNGFPVPAQVLHGVRAARGIDVSLPSQGVVFLTTLDTGASVTLGRGARTPVTYVGIHDPGATAPMGGTLSFAAETDPRGRTVHWGVTGLSGKATDLAAIDQNGVLLAKGLGKVRVTATAGSCSASAVAEVTRHRLIVDSLTDWHKSFAHSANWTFDTLHSQFFEGREARAKRTSDTPESIVYHCPHLIDCAAKVYYTGSFAGKVRLYASPDNFTWAEVDTRSEPAVPTGGQFMRTTIRPIQLPVGTSYVRIEFANDAVIWSPQLAEMRLTGR